MSNDTLQDQIALVRQCVRDEAEHLEEAYEVTDSLHEIADGCVPIYYSDIADVFASNPPLGHGPDELPADPDGNIFDNLQTAIYERLYHAAVDEANELGLLD